MGTKQIISNLASAATVAAVCTFSPLVMAEEVQKSMRGILYAGVTLGGDELANIEFEGDVDNQSIKAGELLAVGGGAEFFLNDSALSLRTVGGIHYDGVFAENGDASFTRYVLEGLVLWSQDKWQFGAGLTYHLSPTLEADFDGIGDGKAKFDNALGVTAEVDYWLNDAVALGVRYTNIQYEVKNAIVDVDIDGSHVGLYAILNF